MFPVEVVTMLGSAVIGGVLKLSRNAQQNRQDNMSMAIKGMAAHTTSADAAANRTQLNGGVWVRRLIVFCAMCIFMFPTLHPLFQNYIGTNIPVSIAYYEENRTILGLFGNLSDKMKYLKLDGIVILPEFRHSLMAIIGFYFGSSSTK